MLKSFHTTAQRRSPLTEVQMLKSGRSARKGRGHELAIALPLTSLIDAFSIIVIYLLIGTQSNGIETPVPGSLNLPIAAHSLSVEKEMPILRIQKGQFFLNGEAVAAQALGMKLVELKEKMTAAKTADATKPDLELIIQADQEMAYADLDPLIKASSLAGIEKLKFAVVPPR